MAAVVVCGMVGKEEEWNENGKCECIIIMIIITPFLLPVEVMERVCVLATTNITFILWTNDIMEGSREFFLHSIQL